MNSRRIVVGMVLFLVLAHFSMHACPVINSVTVTPSCICIKQSAKITAASISWDIYTDKKLYRWKVKTKGIDKTFKWTEDLMALTFPNDIFGTNPPVPGIYKFTLEVKGYNQEKDEWAKSKESDPAYLWVVKVYIDTSDLTQKLL